MVGEGALVGVRRAGFRRMVSASWVSSFLSSSVLGVACVSYWRFLNAWYKRRSIAGIA